MKKRFLAIICAVLLVCPLLNACGCSSLDALSFNSDIFGGSTPAPGYKETATYVVEYKNSSDYYEKDESVTDDILTLDFTNGTYTTELEVLTGIPSTVKTDIELSSSTAVYKLTTKLSIDVNYTATKAGKSVARTDTIDSEVYFYSSAFAPLYSKTTSSYTCISGSDDVKFSIIDSKSEITYNSSKYTVSKDYAKYDASGEKVEIDGTNLTTNDYKYDSKTLIDNAELLFCLRGLTVAEESTVSIPTVSSGYGEYKALSVKNTAEGEKEVAIKLNGEDKTATVKVKNLSYAISSTSSSGVSQKLVVQNGANDVIGSNALLLEYAEPLTVYGSYVKLGTLLYTLKEVNVG